ncbi:MAG: group 1 truncated hemoglobin [Ectothiorhodospiraceae bacterium]|nr:group 1 truncated hemoglobin [Ectothiorhodospiraceae bacterium]MCH8505608.1 group 1 truncated hemoglobin [Ectothiorhodospiraceae bacterium]
MNRFATPWLALALAAMLGACASSGPTRDDSLYQALGEREGIEMLVDGLLFRISENQKILHHFTEADPGRLHRTLTEQFCELSGGPCTYSGDDMVTVHTAMRITEAEFNSLVEDLIQVMEHQRIPIQAQNRLLARLAPMRSEIIGL